MLDDAARMPYVILWCHSCPVWSSYACCIFARSLQRVLQRLFGTLYTIYVNLRGGLNGARFVLIMKLVVLWWVVVLPGRVGLRAGTRAGAYVYVRAWLVCAYVLHHPHTHTHEGSTVVLQ